MKVTVQNTESLKKSLESKGFLFPCGGKGVCGRCRVIAPLLPETALDRRFLTEFERANGWRLSCDKAVAEPMEIEVTLKKGENRKVEDPSVTALIESERVTIGLYDGAQEAERIVVPLPEGASGRDCLAAVQKNSIELYEKHGVAKAVTLGIFASAERLSSLYPALDPARGDCYDGAELSLPSEEGYLAPALPAAPAPLLALALLEGSNAIYRDGATLYFLTLDDPPLCARLVWDAPSLPLSRVLDAAIARLSPDSPFRCYGEGIPKSEHIEQVDDLLPLLNALQSARKHRAAALRLLNRLTPLSLAEDDGFLI